MSLPALPRVSCWCRRLASRVEPIRLFERLYGGESSAFLYESLESSGQQGRYSFIGAKPRGVFIASGQRVRWTVAGQTHEAQGDPLAMLRGLLQLEEGAPPVAPFCGGAVGYLGYDAARWCERLPQRHAATSEEDDAHFLFPQEVICFDHFERVLHVLLYQPAGHAQRFDEIRAAAEAAEQTRRASDPPPPPSPDDSLDGLTANVTREQFESMVRRAQEFILAGDVFQIVLSQRFEFALKSSPLEIYRALRRTNPSPYMYYLRLGEMHIAGSSPESLVTLVGRKAVTRPLAGTRRRGRDETEDSALAAELLADPKERAEHVMLVDLGRNDLGRVCEYGQVRVRDVMQIERHSKVMHLVSTVEGWLRRDADAFDLFRATFPAGTVSGAPKVRAMELIEELEPARRGVYAGAIGYFSVLGDADLCIAIRTIVMTGGKGYIQAGAGIVADSIPYREYQETLNKARALIHAVRMARPGV